VLPVVAGLAFCFVLLAFAVFAIFYTRTRAERQHAIMRAERSRQVAEEAREQLEAERQRAEALVAELQSEGTSEIILTISQDGNVTLSGVPFNLDDLPARLDGVQGQTVVIEAARQCPFERVADVLEICRKAEIEGVQVSVRQGVLPRK
jgi:biopolymer transport protein ExbD